MICGIALFHHLRGRGLRGDGRDGPERDRVGQTDPGGLLHQRPGTVVALGACFASYNWTLGLFAAVAVVVLWFAPCFVAWFLNRFSAHVSEPGVKFVFFLLFALGSLAALAKSEAVLPAYLVGLGLAGVFARHRDTVRRLRTTVFALLTPFYFLNAGMKVYLPALWVGLGLVVVLLAGQDGHQGGRHLAVDSLLRLCHPRRQLHYAC